MLIDRIDAACPFAVPGLVWARVQMAGIPLAEGLHSLTGPEGVRVGLDPALRAARLRRRRDWLAGRLCAADALRRLGVAGCVGMRDGLPRWPQGVAGAISHGGGVAVAVVARGPLGLGVDAEARLPAPAARSLAPAILGPEDWRHRPRGMGRADFVSLIFSARESLYKALSPWPGPAPASREIPLTGCADGILHLRLNGVRRAVHWRLESRCVLTLAVLRQDG